METRKENTKKTKIHLLLGLFFASLLSLPGCPSTVQGLCRDYAWCPDPAGEICDWMMECFPSEYESASECRESLRTRWKTLESTEQMGCLDFSEAEKALLFCNARAGCGNSLDMCSTEEYWYLDAFETADNGGQCW